ncbi:M48 family metallopeptidase [Streptomyces ortus]|uniref:M48 family metallopeptidase n=1 Tax=Streptomyces ortus TaxID=2867268 RepID=A0ABT3VC16_9ACTN|nr:SprT family zinc-dependent metalloprotease [Streptomyces ortus]MCX4236479.1 M48 family metallopeptidase [Streptomyces ortus]
MTALADNRQAETPVDGDSVTVDGISMRVRVSARRKRFALTVEPDATLTLHVPEGRPKTEAEDFARAHREWVVAKLGQRERTRPLNPAKRLTEGEVFRYLGRTYRLAVSDSAPADGRIRLVAGRLVIARRQAEDEAEGRAALVDWYCRAGRAWAVDRVQPWAARMAVGEPELDVRDLGHKWGAYRPGEGMGEPGRMSLGWPLFQLPMHLVDYVIAHELAHVKVSGHGADFWRLVRLALPEYEERRAELDELGRRMWMGEIR